MAREVLTDKQAKTVTSRRTKPELYEEIRQLKKALEKATAAENNIFVPHELKTIEVDTEKKIFKINGEEFGRGCTGFTITCHRYDEFDIRVEVDTTVKFVMIRNGKCTESRQYKADAPWFGRSDEQTDQIKQST